MADDDETFLELFGTPELEEPAGGSDEKKAKKDGKEKKEKKDKKDKKEKENATAQPATHTQLQAELGLYQIVKAATVREGADPNSRSLQDVPSKRLVRVLEVKDVGDRVRAKIESPPGWISLINKTTGVRFAVEVNGNAQNTSIAKAPEDKKEKKHKKDKKDTKEQQVTAIAAPPVAPPTQLAAIVSDKKEDNVKDKKDKKDKSEKKDKKDKKEKQVNPTVAPPVAPPQQLQSKDDKVGEAKKDKKDKKEKKDKKDKKEKNLAPKPSGGEPESKQAKVDEEEEDALGADFWNDLQMGLDDDGADAEARAEEAAALKAKEEAEAAAAALAAQEAAREADPLALKKVKLTEADVELLLSDGAKWLRRVQSLCPGARIAVSEFSQEATVEGLQLPDDAKAKAIRRGVLCVKGLAASLQGDFVDVKELPSDDGECLSVLDLPETAGFPFQPKKLIETLNVVSFFVQEKEPDEPAKPKPTGPIPEFAKALGLHHGQAIECRYEDDWFHGEIVGFSTESGDAVVVEWLGGGEAEMSPIDVRPARHQAPPPKRELRPGGRLVIIGDTRPRMGAMLHAMAAVERKVSGHFSEKNRPRETASLFGFGLKFFRLPDCDGGAVARQCSKISAASEAIVEVLGKHVAIAGEADERRRAEALAMQLIPQAGPFGDANAIPEALAECCSHVRVPKEAVTAVSGEARTALSSIEDETGAMTFWLPISTSVSTRGGHGAVDLGGASVNSGTTVKAKYQNEWHAAKVVGQGSLPNKVCIKWEFDDTEDELPISHVVPASPAQRERHRLLKAPRVLAIVGSEQQRRACALRVLSATEAVCPKLWTSSIEESLAEIRDGLSDLDVIHGVEAIQHDGPEAELEWAKRPQGRQAMQRAAGAAQCVIEYIGRVAFIVGFPHARERGREYWRWTSTARQDGGIRPSSLSVPDADMREDISVLMVPDGRIARLRPDRLLPIERETNTIALFDDGGGAVVPENCRRLIICGGSDEAQRELARLRIEALLKSAADVPALEAQMSRPPQEIQKRPLDNLQEDRDAKVAKAFRTPGEILATMSWPQNINEWGKVQKIVWAGHPQLPIGWIRCWSKSKDCEYYLRLKDARTTFEFQDVR